MTKQKEILQVRMQNLDMDLVVLKNRMERLLKVQRELLGAKKKLKNAMKNE
tara:strand:+ start:129 stop:281 length:153 start_codon:yes stop_codon:yes gene_type:complete